SVLSTMMKRLLLPVALAGLLVACAAAWYMTRDSTSNRGAAAPRATTSQTPLIDDQLLKTARRLVSLADTTEEQSFAREALRLSDHELDQAFATGLREAIAASAPASGPLKQLADTIAQMKARIAATKARIAQLT